MVNYGDNASSCSSRDMVSRIYRGDAQRRYKDLVYMRAFMTRDWDIRKKCLLSESLFAHGANLMDLGVEEVLVHKAC